jgi:ubiquitin-conjugating enzyme E2 A
MVTKIRGPRETFWENNEYCLQMVFKPTYPMTAPDVRFLTPIFHPNVYADGRICLDILANHWSPIYGIEAILTSIRSLLCDPNPDSPANGEAAQVYNQNQAEYIKKNTQNNHK